jgi:ribose transport system substrate-binding protein
LAVDVPAQGIQAAAAEAGDVETDIFDGEFNAEVQFNQIEDIIAAAVGA